MRKDASTGRDKTVAVMVSFGFMLAIMFQQAAIGNENNDIWNFDRPETPPAEEPDEPEPPEVEEPEVEVVEPEPQADEPEPPEVEIDEPEPDVEEPELAPEAEKLTQEEEVRRQERLTQAEERLRQANEQMRENEFQAAVNNYQEAQEIFQQVSRVDEEVRRRVEKTDDLIGNAYDQWAKHLMREAREAADLGMWEEAQQVVEEGREQFPERREEFDRLAEQLVEGRREMEIRDRTRPEVVDPDKDERELDIEVLTEQAKLLYENNRYMDAKRQFEEVLERDPYSLKAVRYLRKISEEVEDAGEERRIATRRQMLAESTWTWSQPVKPV